jgi:hypothetical protein
VRPATAATERAAQVTAGRLLLRDGAPASVYYTASCGGRTEIPSDVWPGAEDPPFLPSRDDDACQGAPAWTAELDERSAACARASGFRGDRLRGVSIASRTRQPCAFEARRPEARSDFRAGSPRFGGTDARLYYQEHGVHAAAAGESCASVVMGRGTGRPVRDRSARLAGRAAPRTSSAIARPGLGTLGDLGGQTVRPGQAPSDPEAPSADATFCKRKSHSDRLTPSTGVLLSFPTMTKGARRDCEADGARPRRPRADPRRRRRRA